MAKTATKPQPLPDDERAAYHGVAAVTSEALAEAQRRDAEADAAAPADAAAVAGGPDLSAGSAPVLLFPLARLKLSKANVRQSGKAEASVAFLFKQWGEFAPGEIAGEYLDPEKAAKGYSLFDGRWDEEWSMPDGHCDDEPDVYRIGKRRAGNLLDGRQHLEFPA